MKYIFFDIECACVYKNVAKICAFGYCITDTDFNLLEQNEFLINPKGRFNLTNDAGQGLILPYNYNDFKRYPYFPEFYNRIQSLLREKDVLIVGHAAVNDAKFLNLETRRYQLKKLNYKYYDTQILYMASSANFEKCIGLEELAKLYSIADKVEHSAVKDAFITMQSTKAICKKAGMGLQEFIHKHKIIAGEVCGGRIKLCTSLEKEAFLRKKAQEQKQKAEKREKFHSYVRNTKFVRKSNLLQGLQFTFEKSIEEDFMQAQALLHTVIEHGATYTTHATHCTAYLAIDKESLQKRTDIDNLKKIGQIQQIYTVDELQELVAKASLQ